MESIKKVIRRKDKVWYWKQGDLHTNFGVIKENELKKGGKLKSHSGTNFTVHPTTYPDIINKIKRGPQTLLAKDIAIILFYTGVNKDYKVVDAGTGCGLLAASIGRIAKEVTTYELNESSIKIAEHNLKFLDVKNVKIKNKNIYEGINEKKLDLVTLDLPEPWQVLAHAEKALKPGGFLVAYLPTITQVSKLVDRADDYDFVVTNTIEILEREWYVEGRKVRPKSQMQGHTAFLVFLRRL